MSMSERARMRVDARLSPAEEAQCVSVEVEGERRVSFYKSGQIRGTETRISFPLLSLLCFMSHNTHTHTPLMLLGQI